MRLLGIYAHPDDEAYTLGGTMANAIGEGIDATILTFTRGEAGGITEGSGATRENLGEVREAELRAACRILGCDDVRIVGTPDGGTKAGEEGIQAIIDVIHDVQPDVVVTMEPSGITSHPDHVAVSQMTFDAVHRVAGEGVVKRLFFAAVSQTMFDQWNAAAAAEGQELFASDDDLAPKAAPDDTIACVIDIGDTTVKRKIEALWAHKTQSQEFVASQPAHILDMAMRIESFQRPFPPFKPGDPITNDLFDGLR